MYSVLIKPTIYIVYGTVTQLTVCSMTIKPTTCRYCMYCVIIYYDIVELTIIVYIFKQEIRIVELCIV